MKIKITSRGTYVIMEDGQKYTVGPRDVKSVVAMAAARLKYQLENPHQEE